jgi:hypothetical protein
MAAAYIADWAAEVPDQEHPPRASSGQHTYRMTWRQFVSREADEADEADEARDPLSDLFEGAKQNDDLRQLTKSALPTHWALVVGADGGLWVITFMTPKGGFIPNPDVWILRQEVGRGSITGSKGREHYHAQAVEITKTTVFADRIIATSHGGLTLQLDAHNMLRREQLLHDDVFVNVSFAEACQLCANHRAGKQSPPSQMVSQWDTSVDTAPVVTHNTERQETRVQSKGARCAHGNLLCMHQKTETGAPRHSKRNGRERCVMMPDVGSESFVLPSWQQ